MPRRIVGAILFALLIIGSALVPALWESAAARQASPAAETPCAATTAEENEALIRRYLEEAYNGRNPELAHDLLANHFVRHSVAAPNRDQATGNADDVARVEGWLTAFPDLHISIEKLVATEDTVVVWAI